MSKKIALTIGFATLVSLSAGNAFATDKSVMVDGIHAKQAEIRMEVAELVGEFRLGRIHAKQAQARMEVAELLEKSRTWGVDPVTVAYLDRAKEAEGNQPQLAKNKGMNAQAESADIDG
ncbi:hypothetical protein ACFL12_04440 [Pseudomonadota bacterium]